MNTHATQSLPPNCLNFNAEEGERKVQAEKELRFNALASQGAHNAAASFTHRNSTENLFRPLEPFWEHTRFLKIVKSLISIAFVESEKFSLSIASLKSFKGWEFFLK